MRNPEKEPAIDNQKLSNKPFNLKFKFKTEYLFLMPALIFLVALMGYPIVYNIILSLKDVSLMNLLGDQNFVGFSNYRAMFEDRVFRLSMQNSLIYTVLSLGFQFSIGLALATFFNQNFPGRNIMRALILVAWMLPIVVSGSIFQWLFAADYGFINYVLQLFGIIDTPVNWLSNGNIALYTVIMTNIWIGIPFNMILLLGGMQSIPVQLYEAAKIDGASKLRQFMHITIPLLKPTMFITLMLGIIYTFKAIDLIIVMTKGGPNNATTHMPFYAYQLAFERGQFSLGAVVATVMFLFLLIISVFYVRATNKEESL